jgi:hypothetical protein
MKNKKRLIYLIIGLAFSIMGGIIIYQLLGIKGLTALFLILWGNNISNSDLFKNKE